MSNTFSSLILDQDIIDFIAKNTQDNCMMSFTKMEVLVKSLLCSSFKEGGTIVEIGTFQGRTAKVIDFILKKYGLSNKVFCVDNFSYGSNWEKSWKIYNKGTNNILVKTDSCKFLSEYPEKDIVFLIIDGDHSYEGCKSDILNSKDKVKIGGCIFLDDYNGYSYPGVKKSVDELLMYEKPFLLLEKNKVCVAFKKIKGV